MIILMRGNLILKSKRQLYSNMYKDSIYIVKTNITSMCKLLLGKYLVSITLHYFIPAHYCKMYFLICIYTNKFFIYLITSYFNKIYLFSLIFYLFIFIVFFFFFQNFSMDPYSLFGPLVVSGPQFENPCIRTPLCIKNLSQ